MKTLSNSMQQHMSKNVWVLAFIMALCLFASPMNAQNAERTVTGVVTSLDGPLLGATIVLKGTTIGVATNESGAFIFPKQLKENDVLIVSYLGYKNREITINQVTSFIEPFLEDNPVLLYGALRTEKTPGTPNK
ncbi:carboxypeptidase-like regulatory domain-containing protein [Rasiella sp. SM2506]|uniref:carboxypeptidase-like regulatory domain-containing protein n=1 Tax=Rasiella sp. SM2506 TaxID=3423914 RepID=UPI003D79328A